MIYLLITEREIRRERWESALERSLGWAVEDSEKTEIKSGTQILFFYFTESINHNVGINYFDYCFR